MNSDYTDNVNLVKSAGNYWETPHAPSMPIPYTVSSNGQQKPLILMFTLVFTAC